jgi:hypothetical protein
MPSAFRGDNPRHTPYQGEGMLYLILAIVLLVIAIAGGAIVHPILFALGIVALVMFFMHFGGRRGAAL